MTLGGLAIPATGSDRGGGAGSAPAPSLPTDDALDEHGGRPVVAHVQPLEHRRSLCVGARGIGSKGEGHFNGADG